MRLTGIPILVALALSGCAATGPAPSPTDPEAMSRSVRESYCVAWLLIDNAVALDAGEISQQESNEAASKITWELQDKGDNYDYAGDFRRMNAAVEAIIASRPDEGEARAAIGYCERYLRV